MQTFQGRVLMRGPVECCLGWRLHLLDPKMGRRLAQTLDHRQILNQIILHDRHIHPFSLLVFIFFLIGL